MTVTRASLLDASPELVWERIASFDGVNDELGPWLRMTLPKAARDLTLDTVPLNEKIGRSWILFLRVIPVDYDDLVLVELEPGRRFLERSQLMSMSSWDHERIVEPSGSGTRVTDRLSFVLRRPLRRVPGAARLATWVVDRLFGHRHRRLIRHFGPHDPGR